MKIILFLFYYLKLRLSALFGIYRTVNPLNLTWRWRQWNRSYLAQRKQSGKKRGKSLQKMNPSIIQKSLNKEQSPNEFKDLIAEAATQAIENLEEMHREDIIKRKKIRKG